MLVVRSFAPRRVGPLGRMPGACAAGAAAPSAVALIEELRIIRQLSCLLPQDWRPYAARIKGWNGTL